MIRLALSRFAGWLLASLFALCALVLIAIDIFGFRLSDLKDLIDQPQQKLEISEQALPDEIRQYVLFTSVAHKNRQVTTGVQYVSTAKRVVEKQWCYLNQNGIARGSSTQLSLATIVGIGNLRHASFSEAALKSFELTNTSATALIKSHCRFM